MITFFCGISGMIIKYINQFLGIKNTNTRLKRLYGYEFYGENLKVIKKYAEKTRSIIT